MKRHLLHDGVVFLQLDTLGGVLTVFGRDVAAGASQTSAFVFGAFQYHLNAGFIPCHDDVF